MPKAIELTQGFVTLVDDADFRALAYFKWYALRGAKGVYAARRNVPGELPTIILMHRYLLNAPEGVEVDHIDNDSLNNVRANLRLATKSQNGASTRRFDETGQVKKSRGIGFYRGKWTASIKVNGKSIYLGRYETEAGAKAAYDAAALKHFGEFARLNRHLEDHTDAPLA
jgi:hypothetical protein